MSPRIELRSAFPVTTPWGWLARAQETTAPGTVPMVLTRCIVAGNSSGLSGCSSAHIPTGPRRPCHLHPQDVNEHGTPSPLSLIMFLLSYPQFVFFVFCFFFKGFTLFFFNFIYLFIYGCVGSSFLCEGFL